MYKKYEERFRYDMGLSERQKDKITMLSTILFGIEFANLKTKDIPNINPEWWEEKVKWKNSMQIGEWQLKLLKNKKKVDWGYFLIRKTKKGYVISPYRNYRFKKVLKTQLVCSYCKKSKLINIMGICEKCEEKLRKQRKYLKYLRGEL